MKFGRPKPIKKTFVPSTPFPSQSFFPESSLNDENMSSTITQPSTVQFSDRNLVGGNFTSLSYSVPADDSIEDTIPSASIWGNEGFVPISSNRRKISTPTSVRKVPSASPFSVATMETAALTSSSESIRDSPFTTITQLESPTAKTPSKIATKQSNRPFSPLTPTDLRKTIRSPTGRKSPFKLPSDDSSRKMRLKTEMCMHLLNGRECPFGDGCTYAHSYKELQKTTLADLHEAGLIDIDTYRIKPCFTWVMTGSCPFGKRCSHIHDPRCISDATAWLPHTETQGNTMDTDINVDALHQKHTHGILYDNPLGESFSLETDGWKEFCHLVCDTRASKKSKRFTRKSLLTPAQKIDIALKMRGTSDWSFKFQPHHIIYGQLCMILQERAFIISRKGNVIPVKKSSHIPHSPFHYLVREIAFGPDSDPSVRDVAIWFDISPVDIEASTEQQAKRFRWKKNFKHEAKSTPFDSQERFPMIRPNDKATFDLITAFLQNRLDTLKAEATPDVRLRNERLLALQSTEDNLRERFEALRDSWIAWRWPINQGRSKIDSSTPAPKAEAHYVPEDTENSEAGRIWESFIFNCTKSKSHWDIQKNSEDKGLSVMNQLREGKPLSEDRTLPTIMPRPLQMIELNSDLPASERCWRSLLLNNNEGEETEWDIVQKHFETSRSKKILTILQQGK